LKRKTPITDVLLDPVDTAIGQVTFADGTKNKNIYLKGFEAGVNVVMEYWKKGIDENAAQENIDFIKEIIFSNGKNAKIDNALGGNKK
jgi:hypothetical protein